jgi:hypothetical protein
MCRASGSTTEITRSAATYGRSEAPLGRTRLDVLARHQPEQADRFGLVGVQVEVLHRFQHRQRVGDQRTQQPGSCLGIVPGAGGLARVVVIVVAVQAQRRGGRVKPTHPPNRRHQLGDRVLGGDRVIQQRGVQRPPLAALDDPVWAITVRTAAKIRSGRSEARNLARHKVSTVGWNP